jgi:glycosyltransferase involved in cell wall biosynthesis
MPVGMENPLISVVVPVYDIEKYIRRCVGTLTEQTYKNIEIILVDDGSADASPAICDGLAEADARLKVLHTANNGQSAAKNAAVRVSKGDYITFVDGDDYVAADYVLHLYELTRAHHADIAITDYRIQRDGEEKFDRGGEPGKKPGEKPPYVLLMNRYEALETLLYQKHFRQLSCGKLFRRSLFGGIEFPEGKVAEDLATFYKLLDRTELVAYSSAADYVYVQRSTSTIHAQRDRVKNDALEFLEEMERYILNKYPNLEKAAAFYCFVHSFHDLKQTPFREVYKAEHAKLRHNLIKYRRSVLTNAKARLSTRACAALSYLGIGTLMLCKAIYDRMKSRI